LKARLTIFSLAVLFGILAATGWASSVVPLSAAITEIVEHPGRGYNPWQWATLVDAYLAFFWFYAWVLYKEPRWGARLGWLIAILLSGNIAMAVYMLWQLRGLPANATAADLLLRAKA
jgi:hypothetical protein